MRLGERTENLCSRAPRAVASHSPSGAVASAPSLVGPLTQLPAQGSSAAQHSTRWVYIWTCISFGPEQHALVVGRECALYGLCSLAQWPGQRGQWKGGECQASGGWIGASAVGAPLGRCHWSLLNGRRALALVVASVSGLVAGFRLQGSVRGSTGVA